MPEAINVEREGRTDSIKCAWCGTPLVFPFKDHGITDYVRAKCNTCKSPVFVFGKKKKHQYKCFTMKQIMRGEHTNGKF
jgi:DNA-directed RNA polymerase subunit RPC12/RpoP